MMLGVVKHHGCSALAPYGTFKLQIARKKNAVMAASTVSW